MDNESETITLTLPTGKKMVEGTKHISISDDIIEYSMIPKIAGNKLTAMTRTFKLKKDFVPAEKAAEFDALFKKMVDADNKEFAMK